jgi:hypothetical protein
LRSKELVPQTCALELSKAKADARHHAALQDPARVSNNEDERFDSSSRRSKSPCSADPAADDGCDGRGRRLKQEMEERLAREAERKSRGSDEGGRHSADREILADVTGAQRSDATSTANSSSGGLGGLNSNKLEVITRPPSVPRPTPSTAVTPQASSAAAAQQPPATPKRLLPPKPVSSGDGKGAVPPPLSPREPSAASTKAAAAAGLSSPPLVRKSASPFSGAAAAAGGNTSNSSSSVSVAQSPLHSVRPTHVITALSPGGVASSASASPASRLNSSKLSAITAAATAAAAELTGAPKPPPRSTASGSGSTGSSCSAEARRSGDRLLPPSSPTMVSSDLLAKKRDEIKARYPHMRSMGGQTPSVVVSTVVSTVTSTASSSSSKAANSSGTAPPPPPPPSATAATATASTPKATASAAGGSGGLAQSPAVQQLKHQHSHSSCSTGSGGGGENQEERESYDAYDMDGDTG